MGGKAGAGQGAAIAQGRAAQGRAARAGAVTGGAVTGGTAKGGAARAGLGGRGARALILLGALVLAGCEAMPAGGGKPQRAALLADGAIQLVAPRGYCLDRAASRPSAQGGFVLFGSCAALHGAGDQPAQPVALSATVSGAAPADGLKPHLKDLSAFLATEAGRAALSRSGKAASVTILGQERTGDLLLLHLRDTSPPAGAALGTDHWRALLAAGGHMVSLSTLPRADAEIVPDLERSLLLTFAAGVSAPARAPAPVSAPAPAP